jgi:hypothetical protein
MLVFRISKTSKSQQNNDDNKKKDKAFYLNIMHSYLQQSLLPINRDNGGHDRMVVGLTTTYVIGAFHR